MRSGYGQICPVAVACEVFAQRWTPLVLREIFAGSQHFNEIHRGVPMMSRALLAERLRTLEAQGVIAHDTRASGAGECYRLTESGREFHSVIEALGTWGQRWTIRVERDNLDPSYLMWNVRRRIALDRLPPRRTIVRLKYSGVPLRCRGPRIFWLILEPAQAELCIKDPGYEVDLYVEADLGEFARVWLGDVTYEHALRSGKVQLTGSRELARAFPTWLMLSHFAEVPRPAPLRTPIRSAGLQRFAG